MSFEDMSATELSLVAKQTALETHIEFMWTAIFSREENPPESAKKVIESARSLTGQGEGPVSNPEHQLISEENRALFQ